MGFTTHRGLPQPHGVLAERRGPTRTMLGFLTTDDDTSTDLGPEHIAGAVYGNQTVTDISEAVMGEPRLRDFGSEYFTDYYVIIPLSVDADIDVGQFVFNVPEEPGLTGDLAVLARAYSIENVDEIGQFEGETVPIEWGDNYPSPDMSKIE